MDSTVPALVSVEKNNNTNTHKKIKGKEGQPGAGGEGGGGEEGKLPLFFLNFPILHSLLSLLPPMV